MSFYPSFHSMSNEDRMTLVTTRVTKWKHPIVVHQAYKGHLSNRFAFTVRTRRSTAAIFIKMRFLTWYLVLAECLVVFAQVQDQHNACPSIKPIQDFKMSRFLGQWYAIQDTAMNGKCITYNYRNYRQVQEPGSYMMVATEHISQAHSWTFPSIVFYDLNVSEPSTPGRMETDYIIRVPPDDVILVRNVSHVIFMTDYDTYAGVFKYLPNIYGHRATILSRTKTLDLMHVDKIRQKLSQCDFDISNLKIIEHSDCPERNSSNTIPYNDTVGITI